MTSGERYTVLQRGQSVTVIALVADGGAPAKAFLEGLDARAQAGFRARLEHLASQGRLRTPEQMRPLQVKGEPRVWEIKVDTGPGYRLYMIQCGRFWVATGGGPKPRDRAVTTIVQTARRIFDEWGGCGELV
jgi:putative component of toxin-antitoxin plasmid stabilization module